ncbi:hypothetical protein ACSYAY_09020 [Leptospirillum ferriphilum]|uniref:hypothetical protein n=1 Tax=Leptospirillum ferriphilum TaxID=178606 RepID=UPI00117A5714|nr:hypothetical protein [Leptospirillum ferriphilum]
MKIIGEFYQREHPVSNEPDLRKERPGLAVRSCMMFWPFFVGLTILSSSAYGEDLPGLHLRLPDHIQSGEDWPLRITFDHAPPENTFYRLFVKIDGTPVAFSDLSRGRQTTINIPATHSGRHRLSLTWKNPPGGKAIVIRRIFQVPGR